MKKWQCFFCGYIYDEEKGEPEADVAPGTPWSKVPDSFLCPDCGAAKADFEMLEIE